jgi:hypothetical protein
MEQGRSCEVCRSANQAIPTALLIMSPLVVLRKASAAKDVTKAYRRLTNCEDKEGNR